jgi:catechol 2,3-dioxygenase-like lactoylglutathione lyase family enzyme
MATLPGPIRQIGFIVKDFDAALASWLAVGIGPWFVMRGVKLSASYRGQPCEVSLTIGWANSGDMQVEVMWQEDDTPSIYTEFLDSGREGFHQLAWWTSDFEATMREVEADGWPIVWSGGQEGVRYAYAGAPSGPATVVEISELNDMVAAFNQLIRDAADGWDGSDPIRTLG